MKSRSELTRRAFLEFSTATQSAILSMVAPALETQANLRREDAVTYQEAKEWRRRFVAMPVGTSKSEAARILAEECGRSWQTIRRHL